MTSGICTLYHSCNLQCRDDIHAILVYSEFDDTTLGLPGDTIRFELDDRALEFVNYYRVREPISRTPQAYNHLTVYDVPQSHTACHAYVVFVRIIDSERIQFFPEVCEARPFLVGVGLGLQYGSPWTNENSALCVACNAEIEFNVNDPDYISGLAFCSQCGAGYVILFNDDGQHTGILSFSAQ